jgi:hypothetical protein
MGKINGSESCNGYALMPHRTTISLLLPFLCSQSHLVMLRADLWLAFLHTNIINTGRWEDCQFSICKQKPPASTGVLSYKGRHLAVRLRQTKEGKDTSELFSGGRELAAPG